MPPRIAHVISTLWGGGGAERVVQALVNGGAERGWRQRVLNPFAIDAADPPLRSACAEAEFAAHGASKLHELPGLCMWLRRQLEDFRPDVVHVHLFHAAVLCASIRIGVPTLLTHHHADLLDFERRRLDGILDRWAGRRYDRVVAVSRWGESFLRHRYGYSPGKVILIRNGWEGSPLPRTDGDRPPTVICVGHLRPEKGHELLLIAFCDTLARVPTARLRIVGDGEQRASLERLAVELCIDRAVDFMGSVDDVWRELSRADVFVLASHQEPLGIAVMEAMAAGLPTVAFAVGGIPELIDRGKTGTLVAPSDTDALARGLTEMLLSPERARSMGEAGRQVATSLRAETMVESYFALYGSVLPNRVRSPADQEQ